MADDDKDQQKLQAWFQILHRLARIQETDITAPAWTDQPLEKTIAEMVAGGFIKVLDPKRRDGKVLLLLQPTGWDLYDMFCEDLASRGWPIQGWVPGRHADIRQLARRNATASSQAS